MKHIFNLTILFFSVFVNAQQKKSIFSTFNITTKERLADYENFSAPDSVGIIMPLKSTLDNKSTGIHIPYPIIFIHGLADKSSIWDETTDFMDSEYGFTYGGRFDFCLNYDGNNTTTNKIFYPTPGADIALYTPTLIAGDYYYLNFAVGNDGSVYPTSSNSYYVKSEQQAIVKQGAALAYAIYYVLQRTGRNKVVLMGHSMGGLASREYIQNSNNWQPVGQHHVAKLVTTGTPHGGSNSTSFGLSFGGIDEQSEAVRDLRRTYYYSEDSGVYLYGGLELQNNTTNMDDNWNLSGIDFYNVDVNCNGIEGEFVTGLNNKNISTDIDYSCIIGDCNGCIVDVNSGDGVVSKFCANLNNYYPSLNANIFYYTASAISEIHTGLPLQTYENLEGLDEPNDYALAYHIGIDTTYLGFSTVQSTNCPYYPIDYDDYKFSVSVNSNINISINNIALMDLKARIVDLAGNVVGSVVNSNGSSSLNFIQLVNAGVYYLEIYGTPTSISYLYPYNFLLSQTIIDTDIAIYEKLNNILIYPNPATNTLNIKGILSKTIIKSYDVFGNLVIETETESDKTINVSQLMQGVYTFVFESKNERIFKKVIITK